MVVQTRKVKNPTIASTDIATWGRSICCIKISKQTDTLGYRIHINSENGKTTSQTGFPNQRRESIMHKKSAHGFSSIYKSWKWTKWNMNMNYQQRSLSLLHLHVSAPQNLSPTPAFAHRCSWSVDESVRFQGIRKLVLQINENMALKMAPTYHQTFLAILIRMTVITLLMKSNYPAMSQGLED